MIVTVVEPTASAVAGERPAAGLSLEALPGTKQPLLTPGEQGPVPVSDLLGVRLVTNGPVNAGLELHVHFDSRVYALNPDAVLHAVLSDGSVQSVEVTRGPATTDAETGSARVEVKVMERLAAGATVSLVLGRLRTNLYPYDVVRDFAETAVTGVETQEGKSVTASLQSSSTAVTRGVLPWPDEPHLQPWGCEAGVLWEEIRWGSGLASWCARRASALAVGPGPTPAGYGLRVVADARVVRHLAVSRATDLNGRSVSGAFRTADGGGRRGV